ncbi:MAG: lysine N(6)-hydroxylase/L-ornithine N(5)-oxygenase family protein [Ginsengibacter sp.]
MDLYDILGIGIGPSNLSTAALIYPHRETIKSIFFDDKDEFSWHPGMLFPEATIQVSILKDLVTMVDPTSPFSFLNFLKETGRLYLFAAKGKFDNLKRREFVQYFKWVVDKLPNLVFSSKVEEVSFDQVYTVKVNGQKIKAKNLVLGAGLTSNVPEFCVPFLSSSLFHSSQFLTSNINYANKKIMVVGGGQSGAEVVLHLLNDQERLPQSISWICSNYNFLPLENTPFSNELYTPGYSDYFYKLHLNERKSLLEKQKFTSDGISEKTLNEIYELIYNYKFLLNVEVLDFYLGSYFTKVRKNSTGFSASIVKKQTPYLEQQLDVDIIILTTGFRYKAPACLQPLMQHFSTTDDKFDLAEDYSIVSDGRLTGKIYLHNGARHIRGVADPNLSLIAWRSAKILNSVAGENIYKTGLDKSLINWEKQLVQAPK